jgi:hypothetical protein
MRRPSWFHPLVSLTGALGLLAISVWLDNFLALRQKFAQASFEYNQLFLTLIIGSLLIFIGSSSWVGLCCTLSAQAGD